MEISLYGSSEVYRSQTDVLGRSARGPARTFGHCARQRVKAVNTKAADAGGPVAHLQQLVHHYNNNDMFHIKGRTAGRLKYCWMGYQEVTRTRTEKAGGLGFRASSGR